jgi:hypothetical protein
MGFHRKDSLTDSVWLLPLHSMLLSAAECFDEM